MTIDLAKTPSWVKTPHFDMFIGNNHNRVYNHQSWYCGSVDLGYYVGKDFNDSKVQERLWHDLFRQMTTNTMRIYRPGDAMWLDGQGEGACYIYLNDGDIIGSISFTPIHDHSRSDKYKELHTALESKIDLLKDIEGMQDIIEIYERLKNGIEWNRMDYN